MKWIKSQWTKKIGPPVFSLLLTMIYDFFKQNPFLSTIIEIVKWVGNTIIFILNYEIKVWWILCVIIAIVIVIIFINLRKWEIFKPDFCNYKKDRFKDWKWRWDWKYYSNSRKWDIISLIAYCPKCDTQLIDHSNVYEQEYRCPRCKYNARSVNCEDPIDVKAIIFDNIEKKKYNK